LINKLFEGNHLAKILIVEDEAIIRSALKRFLGKQGFKVSEASSVNEATASFEFQSFDLIITDLRLPGPPGTDIIERARGIPVLIMTSYASLRSAVDAMKMGAADYIAKPFDYQELLEIINNTIGDNKSISSGPSPIQGMLGKCSAMLDLMERIQKVAPTKTNVLIEGESGTGKELVAKALHKGSDRHRKEMISLNCAAIPDSLIESELFGHEKGAFTGATSTRMGMVEAANDSTLFLDEIGELPLDAQARLLRVLQEGEIRRVGSTETRKVNVRLLAATHRNLKELSSKGQFREDLYYRLNVLKLSIPPLRERGDDLQVLSQSILVHTCDYMGKGRMSFSPEAIEAMRKYRWPGNVRELENAIERAVILCEGNSINPELLAIDSDLSVDEKQTPMQLTDNQQDNVSLEDYFQQFVVENQDHMTETELAAKLGISRKNLWERRQRLNIPREKSRKS
jgi:DNA-binding NtrC family response regulator